MRIHLRHYAQFASEVAAQGVACNSVHNVEQRLARWLLITADAIGSNTFDITQEFLSQMLAVRRPGVTVAMGALGRRALLSHRYGKVTLLDVPGLKQTSCECYRRIQEKAIELLHDNEPSRQLHGKKRTGNLPSLNWPARRSISRLHPWRSRRHWRRRNDLRGGR